MKRNIWIGGVAAAAIAFGTGAAAQTGSSTKNSGKSDQRTVTVTGCLKQAEPMSGGAATSGTSGSSSGSSRATGGEHFVLTNASVGAGSSASSGSTGSTGATSGSTSGTSSSASSMAGSGSTYQLEGKTSELRQHVNHQVQVTGRLESGSMSGTSGKTSSTGSTGATGSTSSGSTSAGTAAAGAHGQRLRVESVKMIASSCS